MASWLHWYCCSLCESKTFFNPVFGGRRSFKKYSVTNSSSHWLWIYYSKENKKFTFFQILKPSKIQWPISKPSIAKKAVLETFSQILMRFLTPPCTTWSKITAREEKDTRSMAVSLCAFSKITCSWEERLPVLWHQIHRTACTYDKDRKHSNLPHGAAFLVGTGDKVFVQMPEVWILGHRWSVIPRQWRGTESTCQVSSSLLAPRQESEPLLVQVVHGCPPANTLLLPGVCLERRKRTTDLRTLNVAQVQKLLWRHGALKNPLARLLCLLLASWNLLCHHTTLWCTAPQSSENQPPCQGGLTSAISENLNTNGAVRKGRPNEQNDQEKRRAVLHETHNSEN